MARHSLQLPTAYTSGPGLYQLPQCHSNCCPLSTASCLCHQKGGTSGVIPSTLYFFPCCWLSQQGLGLRVLSSIAFCRPDYPSTHPPIYPSAHLPVHPSTRPPIIRTGKTHCRQVEISQDRWRMGKKIRSTILLNS